MNGIWLENLCVDIGAEGVKSNKVAQRTVDVNCFCLCVFFFSYPDQTDVNTGLAVNSIDDIFIVKARLATSRPHEFKSLGRV